MIGFVVAFGIVVAAEDFVDHALATVLGIVGAGGIGVILWEQIRGFNYAGTAATIIVIVISVTVLDIVSQRLRKMVT